MHSLVLLSFLAVLYRVSESHNPLVCLLEDVLHLDKPCHSSPPPPPPICECSSPMEKFGEKCLYYDDDNDWLSYEDALAFCHARNWRLVSILNEDENNQLRRFLEEKGVSDAWTSGHRMSPDRTLWSWPEVASTPMNYQNWAPGEPNDGAGNVGEEDCIAVTDRNENLLWNDAECYSVMGFVCEVACS